MADEHLNIKNIPAIIWGDKSPKVYLYIHGQGGDKEEAEVFASIANRYGWQVLSIDLPEHGERKEERDLFNPWTIVPELLTVMQYAKTAGQILHYLQIVLVHGSVCSVSKMKKWKRVYLFPRFLI